MTRPIEHVWGHAPSFTVRASTVVLKKLFGFFFKLKLSLLEKYPMFYQTLVESGRTC